MEYKLTGTEEVLGRVRTMPYPTAEGIFSGVPGEWQEVMLASVNDGKYVLVDTWHTAMVEAGVKSSHATIFKDRKSAMDALTGCQLKIILRNQVEKGIL